MVSPWFPITMAPHRYSLLRFCIDYTIDCTGDCTIFATRSKIGNLPYLPYKGVTGSDSLSNNLSWITCNIIIGLQEVACIWKSFP